jgi:hypothetical protein
MRTVPRPLLALCAAAMMLPLAACVDDGYGPNQGYGPPPPPPPPQGRDGYYRDAPPPQGGQGGYYDDRGGPPPQGGDQGGYYDDRGAPPPPPQGQSSYPYRQAPPPADARGYDQGQPYYPERDYRPEPGQERALSRNDEVYRGQDGQYYCKRSDGTTGLIIGALAGGLFGNIIDGGRHRALGTLLGAGGGAVAGQAIDQGQVRCR